MKLKVRAFSYAFAILYGLFLFLAALLASGGTAIPFFNAAVVEMMQDMFPGYSATPQGAIVGLIYGLIWGGVWGWLIAWLYNKLL